MQHFGTLHAAEMHLQRLAFEYKLVSKSGNTRRGICVSIWYYNFEVFFALIVVTRIRPL